MAPERRVRFEECVVAPMLDIFRCPRTGGKLLWDDTGALVSEDGARFPYVDGVALLQPEAIACGNYNQSVRDFYDSVGWRKDARGCFADTAQFVDTRTCSYAFTRRCITRLGRYFRDGGEVLLDAGSGPIPHDELLKYGDRFRHRICIDLSAGALSEAKRKLGDRGICLQGDLTNLPLAADSVDAISCNHVIYQLSDPELQKRAFLELWRVLKPGGVAVIVYWWSHSPLAWRLERLAQLCGVRPRTLPPEQEAKAAPSHHPMSRAWFEAQDWPFEARYDVFRAVSNHFMRTHVPNDWRGRIFYALLGALQDAAPAYCGRHGAIPAIIIRKPAR